MIIMKIVILPFSAGFSSQQPLTESQPSHPTGRCGSRMPEISEKVSSAYRPFASPRDSETLV
jgi:hypothetical protein